MPWKLLLRMGKIKPTPEAIDSFMMLGDRMSKRVKDELLRIATEDIYWGVITPSQAALMLYGLPPPTPLETISLMEKTFVEKEKMLEPKYIKILEKIVGIYKDFEHGKIKEIKGEEIDSLLKDSEDYIKRLKELVKQIEKLAGEKTVMQLYDDTFSILQNIFGRESKGSEQKLVEQFKKEIINKGEFAPRSFNTLQEIIKARADYKKGKLTRQEIDRVRRDAQEFIHSLTEYTQRKELIGIEKTKLRVKIDGSIGELYLFADAAYLTDAHKKDVKKINFKLRRLEESNLDELTERLKNIPKELELTTDRLRDVEKILGKDISLVFN